MFKRLFGLFLPRPAAPVRPTVELLSKEAYARYKAGAGAFMRLISRHLGDQESQRLGLLMEDKYDAKDLTSIDGIPSLFFGRHAGRSWPAAWAVADVTG